MMVTLAVLYAFVALNCALIMVRDGDDNAFGHMCLAAVWLPAAIAALAAIAIDEAIARYKRSR